MRNRRHIDTTGIEDLFKLIVEKVENLRIPQVWVDARSEWSHWQRLIREGPREREDHEGLDI